MKNEKRVKDEPHSEFTKEEQQEFLNLLDRITPEQREALKKVLKSFIYEEGCQVTQWSPGILLFCKGLLYSGRNARIKSKIAILCEGESLSQMVKRDFCSSVKW